MTTRSTSFSSSIITSQKGRIFEPVILFHDHTNDGSRHTTIPYMDPHQKSIIEKHKQRMQQMLDINGKLWTDQVQDDKMTLPSLSTPLPPTRSSPPHRKQPLSTSQSTGTRKRRGNLPKAVTCVLRDWLADHKRHPYPTDEEKLVLSQQTNLTLNQVSNWFINARRRILLPMLKEDRSAGMTFLY